MSDFDFEKTISSDYANISKDFLEIGLDSILEDGLLKDIPVINTITAFAKIGINIKDRLFIKKLLYFLYETQNVPTHDRIKLINSLNDSSEYQSKIGEKLIFILDKSDEVIKARFIGQLFNFVLKGKLGYNMFIRCSESMNKVFAPDLLWFLSKSHYEFGERIERDGLLNAGILKAMSAEGETMMGTSTFELKYDISEIGLCLHKYLGKSEMKLESIRERNDDKNKW